MNKAAAISVFSDICVIKKVCDSENNCTLSIWVNVLFVTIKLHYFFSHEEPTDSPIDCNLVDCAVPDCPNPVVPEGQCCPVCPVTRLGKLAIGHATIKLLLLTY